MAAPERRRWFTIGRDTDFGNTGKPFMGIGPDDVRMSRGLTMPWPYEEKSGEINEIYMATVRLEEFNARRETLRMRMTEKALNDWMDDLMNERIPFPTLAEFTAKFKDPKYSAFVIKQFADSMTVLMIQALKKTRRKPWIIRKCR